jgi:hypothetical protein
MSRATWLNPKNQDKKGKSNAKAETYGLLSIADGTRQE